MTEPHADLLEVVADLGADEVRTLVVLARRLLDGQGRYGRIDLAHDTRDFRRERAFEVEDLLIYSAFLELQALEGR